ncbi:MAG: ATP phosphoribosyltransferase regulatory subunit [Pseudomonadota bacterium]
MLSAPESDVRRETAALLARFEGLGARRIEAGILQPAEVLLDLYGEDIRGRAYVTQDPLRGEQMLRPDFTVPVVQMHMAEGAEPARYTYAGPVFRRQEEDLGRPSEYPQVGYEVFDRSDPARVEVELFGAFHEALQGLNLHVVMGDMAILSSAVASLETTEHRKAALMRHLWRPRKFRALLDRFSAPSPGPVAAETGPEIGVRTAAEVAERRARMAADAEADRLDPRARARLEDLLGIAGALPEAMVKLEQAAAELLGIKAPLATLKARVAELATVGVDPENLHFEVSYGRTSMEYYDGFVFGFTADGKAPVATGGRYDALTKVLGQGRSVPAIGGVIRPDLVAELRGADA